MPTMNLACKLSQDEKRLRGEALVNALDRLDGLDEELAAAKERIKTKKKPVQAEATELRRSIRSGTEFREIEVRKEADTKRGVWMIFREDTGDHVEDRKMTEEEILDARQGKLFVLEDAKGSQQPTPQ